MADPTASELRALKAKGHAMAPAAPGGKPRFYIRNRADLQNAIDAVGRANGPHNDVRAFIIRRARQLGAMDMIPSNWTPSGSNTGAKSAKSGK